jgi:hypothetical protein
MLHAGQTFHDRLRATLLPVLFAGLLGAAGCARAQSEAQVSDPSLPAGAIATGDGIYMVPIAPDETGCMQYRMHAPGKAVVQVIMYRQADGKFTADRSKADCAKKP